MTETKGKCEALCITSGQRCTAPARYNYHFDPQRRVCGRHRSPWVEFVTNAAAVKVDAKSEAISAGNCAEIVMVVMREKTASAASQIEQVVREADWLWRRRFGDRGVRR